MKLTKKIITSKDAKNLIDVGFSELKKEQEKPTVSMFFKQYNRLFFDIPKSGANSHQMIVERSKTYTEDVDVALPKDKLIEELNLEIIKLETELTDFKIATEAKNIAKKIESFNDEKTDKGSKSS
tara:strand:- start:143 stop:517 length:375 start_codon:yes stop_codon:yes gene_type:complete